MANLTPFTPDTQLTTDQLVEALDGEGYHYSANTFVNYRVSGQGPPFVKNSRTRTVTYPWGTALQWARGQLSPPVRSNREAKKWQKNVEAKPAA